MGRDLRRVGTEGLIAGMIGYLVIVLFFAIFDLAAGRSAFYTPALLGAAFLGTAGGDLSVQAGPVLAWNGLHLFVFLIFGVISARVAVGVERTPRAFFPALYAGVAAFLILTTLVYGFAAQTGHALSFWTIEVAMLFAVTAMLVWLLAIHPRLRTGIAHLDELDDADANGLAGV